MAKYKLVTNGVTREDGASIPNAPGNRDWQEYQEWLAADNTPDPQFTPEEILANTQAGLTNAVQAHLDTKAKEKNYDNILSACTYATSTNPQFKAEGQACVGWRDAVWSYCYQVMADVMAGHRAIPTVEELIAELPVLKW